MKARQQTLYTSYAKTFQLNNVRIRDVVSDKVCRTLCLIFPFQMHVHLVFGSPQPVDPYKGMALKQSGMSVDIRIILILI